MQGKWVTRNKKNAKASSQFKLPLKTPTATTRPQTNPQTNNKKQQKQQPKKEVAPPNQTTTTTKNKTKKTLSHKKKPKNLYQKNKQTLKYFYWVVGFGDNLRGRRESVQKYVVLQTFPPNPVFQFLFCPP